MSPLARGHLLSYLLILSVACYAVEAWWGRNNNEESSSRGQGHGGSGGRTNNGGGNVEPPPDRTNTISQMPTYAQEELFKKILGTGNVKMNENNSPADITPSGKLPEIINSLANGAIDALVSQIPGIGTLLGPLIKGGLDALFSSFGKKKVYIPNMPPVINCPPNIEVPQEKGKHSAIVNWQEPLGFDAEDGRITKVHRSGKKPGSRFNGEESIQYTVYDSKGRSDTCFMHVKIKIIRCPNVQLQRNRENTCSGPSFYGKSCHFSCSEGHTLIGPKTITCESDGRFDQQAPRCKINTCPQPELPHGGERWDCSDTYNYNSACTIQCKAGYRNSASNDRAPWNVATIECRADGTWTRMPECKDVSAPEIINCPGFTLKYADRGKNSTVVRWADIIATDSNHENVTVTQVEGPPSGSEFAKGAHKISYEAVDNVGLKDTCTFFVNVEVRTCPVPELTHEKLDIDCGGHFNYGAACTISCVQGITLEGSSRITCEENGNKMEWSYPNGQPTCLVKKCPRLFDPPNARFDCTEFAGGLICNLKCNKGFIPARNEDLKISTCSPSVGKWKNDFHPGCVKKRQPKTLSDELLFYWKAPCTNADTANVTNVFQNALENRNFMRDCPGCRVENVRTACRSRTSYKLLAVRWAVSVDIQPEENVEYLSTKLQLAGVAMKNWLNDRFVSLPVLGAQSRTPFRFKGTGNSVSCDPSTKPSSGSSTCAACGLGFQFDGKNGCEKCPEGTYQDDSGDAKCQTCPSGTQTVGIGKTKSRDCKSPCPKGTVSPTGLTPCRDCPIGEYQNVTGQKQCKSCRSGQLTNVEASQSVEDCYVPPGKVVRLRAASGEDSVKLTWFVPYKINGILLGYRLQYHQEGNDTTTTKEIQDNRTESYDVMALTPNTPYVFTIYSLNQYGKSLPNTIEATTLNVTQDQTGPRVQPTVPTVPTPAQTTAPVETTTDPRLCPPGTMSHNGQKYSDGTCQNCGKGYYQDQSGQTECQLCDPGFTTFYEGSVSKDDCVDETWTTPTTTTTTTPEPTTLGQRCDAGSISQTGFEPGCTPCPQNKIPNNRQDKCLWCPLEGGKFICSPKTTTAAATTEAATTAVAPETTTADVPLTPEESNQTKGNLGPRPSIA